MKVSIMRSLLICLEAVIGIEWLLLYRLLLALLVFCNGIGGVTDES
jgi:hypothetical protein